MENEIVITNHTPQDISIEQRENQLIFVNGGGQVIGITDVRVNGSSVVTNNIAYVIVPTKTSELQNNSGFITTETDPTVPSYVKTITRSDINKWNNKQDTLVSGTNIKTINNNSLLGSGNIEVGSANYIAGNGINIDSENVISNTITSYNDLTDLPTIPTKTSDLLNDSDFVSENELSEVAFTGSYVSLSNVPTALSDFDNDTHYVDRTSLNVALARKQDELVSGVNIKSINNQSILGSGNITISGGTPTDVQINGTSIVSNDVANIITESAYNSSSNKIATMNDIPKKNILSAKPSADVTLPGGSYIDINNLTATTTIGSGLSISSGKIKIGSGISNIKVTVCMGIYANTNNKLYSFLTQNGTTVSTWLVSNCNGFSSFTRNDIISVSENDLISFNIYLQSGGELVNNRTSIIVESV